MTDEEDRKVHRVLCYDQRRDVALVILERPGSQFISAELPVDPRHVLPALLQADHLITPEGEWTQ